MTFQKNTLPVLLKIDINWESDSRAENNTQLIIAGEVNVLNPLCVYVSYTKNSDVLQLLLCVSGNPLMKYFLQHHGL